jgi:serine/threonine-protein kinase RsbW
MAQPAIIDGARRMENSPQPAEWNWNYTAKTKDLRAALDAIEQACSTRNIDAALVSRARIVVEELFSNTIKYGYGGECDQAVRIGLTTAPQFVILYEDDAPLFDPTGWKSKEDEGVLPGQRPEGRAGIAMVMGLCATAVYQAWDGRNRLILTFAG